MKKILALLSLVLTVALAHGAELPPPGSTGNLAGNGGGFWAPFTFSNCTVTGTSISCPGAVSGYPAAGIPQSTGSAWGSSITAGAGVVTGLGIAVNTSGGFLTYGGIPYASLPALAANQWLGALTATTPSGQSWPSCSAAGNFLQYTSGTGVGCVTTGYPAANLSGSSLPAGITGSSLTSLGTIAAGTWNGTAIGSQWGGTGQNASAATGIPYLTTGSWAFSNALPSAVTATTQTGANNTTALATTAYADNEAGLVGATTVSTTGGSTTLTATQYATPTILVTGVLASNATLVVPNNGRWSVVNNTTGLFTVTVKTSGGTGSLVSQGYASHLIANGTNVIDADSDWYGHAVGPVPQLSSFYRWWSTLATNIVRIENLGDSILTCNQAAPCTYGPARIGSTFALLLTDELSQKYQQYSTGYRPIVRLSNATTTVSAGDGYTLTSGSITNSTLLGPQQSGVSLNGGSLLTLSNAGVITIAVGQPWSSVNIYCVQGTGISGYTVTINGAGAGTACGSGSGASTVTIQNFANGVAQASQPATGTTLTLTALGATNYVYAYEGVLFCGAAQAACTSGFVVDNAGVGGASSPWFASGTKAGATDGGMAWIKILPGKVAMCVLENGENDANSGSAVTSTQMNAQNQIVATDCQNLGASIFWFGPPPYNSGGAPATYAALQQGGMTYCQSQNWACLNMADMFMGDQSGSLSTIFPFTAQNTGAGLTPRWNTAQGMMTNSDDQHLNDCGSLYVTQQFIKTVFPSPPAYPTVQSCNQNPLFSAISTAWTNATTSFTTVQGATANTGQLEWVAPVGQNFSTTCEGFMQIGTTGVVSAQVIGSAAVANINYLLEYQTASASALSTTANATALTTAVATSSITAASNLYWKMIINGLNSTTANSFALQFHEASGTMTIPANARCITQMSGPQ